ncbi:MAG: hypothetical protein ACMZ7B_03855 [Balneola sp.]
MRPIKHIFLFVLLSSVSGCQAPELTRTIYTEQPSPNSKFVAQIIKIGEDYRFAIKSENGTISIVDLYFTPTGYHDPGFTLVWNDESSSIQIEVDHDFGENNLLFEYNLETLDWQEVKKTDS